MATAITEDEAIPAQEDSGFVGDYAEHFLDPDVHSISMNNPFSETGLYSVPKLLRRTANLLDILDDLITDGTVLVVDDTVLERKHDPAEGPVPSLTVYYHRPDDVERRP